PSGGGDDMLRPPRQHARSRWRHSCAVSSTRHDKHSSHCTITMLRQANGLVRDRASSKFLMEGFGEAGYPLGASPSSMFPPMPARLRRAGMGGKEDCEGLRPSRSPTLTEP